MKKAIEIKTEVDKTELRILEFQTQFDEQTASFEATQQAFIAGKSDVNQLHAEQSKLTLISQAIESLKATYQKLKSAFENQSEAEARREQIKKMADAANAVEPLLNDYLKTRNEFNEIVSEYAKTLIDKATAYRNKQREYQTINAKLEPPAANSEIQINDTARRLASATYFNHPPLEYGEAVALAENLLAAKINKAAQAKRMGR